VSTPSAEATLTLPTHVVVVAGGPRPADDVIVELVADFAAAAAMSGIGVLTIAREVRTGDVHWRASADKLRSRISPAVARLRILDTEGVCEVGAEMDRGLSLTLVEGISGRGEIEAVLKELRKNGVEGRDLSEAKLAAALLLSDLPDPDLVIVAGSTPHVPDLFLWQMAYAELVFSATPFAELHSGELDGALDIYRHRDRRYGGLLSVGARS